MFSALQDRFKSDEQCKEVSCAEDLKAPGDGRLYPPNRAQIGRAGWRVLHTMAAEAPETRSAAEEQKALKWLASFIELYPCGHCAHAFVDICVENPPRLRTRDEGVQWWCEAHNLVNRDLSTPLMQCEKRLLMQAPTTYPLGLAQAAPTS